MASIEQLKGVFTQKGGAARSNLFSVTLPSLPGATSRELNLLCRDVTLPGRQITTYEKVIGTKQEKVAYGAINDDVSMTFMLLNDYGIRNYFEVWQSIAYNSENYQIGYKNDYVQDIVITQLKKAKSFPIYSTSLGLPELPPPIQGWLPSIGPIDLAQNELDLDFLTPDVAIYTCKLYNAWPVTMDVIQLNNEMDGLVELRVQFTYTKWSSQFTRYSPMNDFTETLAGSVISQIFNN